MSRIGKRPITIPESVEIKVENGNVYTKGPKGSLECKVQNLINIKIDDKILLVERIDDTKSSSAMQGLMRALISNMIIGVTEGYKKELEMKGIGYKATISGADLVLNIGFSHPVIVKGSDEIKFKVVDGLNITVEGIDKQKVGQTAATIREFKKPEPYKGKGIKYKDEIIRRKAGKAKVKGG